MRIVWYPKACQGFILEIDSLRKVGQLFGSVKSNGKLLLTLLPELNM
jgi:hypothetical protein